MNTLRFAATLAALTLAVSTARAGVMDLGNALGPSGHYTNQASYRTTLGGQPMTAAQQAYADQEDQLRQMGFQSELSGDFASGQMFYRMAYSLTPGTASAGLGWLGAFGHGSPAWRDGGSGEASYGGGSWVGGYSDDSVLTLGNSSWSNGGPWTLVGAPPVPEPSTWAMMLIGFAGLVYAARRQSARASSVVR